MYMINVILRKKSFFQDTMAQLEEMRKAYNLLQEQATHSRAAAGRCRGRKAALGCGRRLRRSFFKCIFMSLFKDCILSYSIIFYNIL